MANGLVLSEREARETRTVVAEINAALSSERAFEPVIAGLPIEVIEFYRSSLERRRAQLIQAISAYEVGKSGDTRALEQQVAHDPGAALIVARLARGFSQKDLARRLGLKEQQVQRYEAERYRSISLANFRRVALMLGVTLSTRFAQDQVWSPDAWSFASKVSATDIKKIVKHGREHGWFDDEPTAFLGEESHNLIQRYISDHIIQHGSPSLLRTGLSKTNDQNDVLLMAWKARVTRLAEKVISQSGANYRGLSISWIAGLPKLSLLPDGPREVQQVLLQHGIVLIVEPQIEGLRLDGVAFRIGSVPVIGLTLRRDTIDGFWFTLMHELAHVVLHYDTGLSNAFFDDDIAQERDGFEDEANRFAGSILVPEHIWSRSPARISKSANAISKFAKDLQIHPAIVFGKIQRERNDYSLFAGMLGQGAIRSQFHQGWIPND